MAVRRREILAESGRGPDTAFLPQSHNMELDRRGAELLFQVLAVASNESFGGWTKTFTDSRLCVAILDRLIVGGNIIETGSESYRLAHTRAQLATSTA